MLSQYSTQQLIDELKERNFDVINSLDDFSDDQIIDYLKSSGYEVFPDSINGAKDALSFVMSSALTYDQILDRFSKQDLADYMNDTTHYMVFSDESDVIDELRNRGYFVVTKNDGIGSNFYRSECINLLQKLIEKNGYDFIYRLIEPFKIL